MRNLILLIIPVLFFWVVENKSYPWKQLKISRLKSEPLYRSMQKPMKPGILSILRMRFLMK